MPVVLNLMGHKTKNLCRSSSKVFLFLIKTIYFIMYRLEKFFVSIDYFQPEKIFTWA